MVEKTKPTPEQIAQGKARAGGQTATSTALADKASEAAKNAGGVPTNTGGGTGARTGLDGRPIGSPVYAGTSTSMPPTTSTGRPVPGAFITKKTQYGRGSGMTYLQTLNNKQRIAALSKLAQIPGAYKNPKDAPTSVYLQSLSSSGLVTIRPEDAAAVENLMYISDTVGENIEDTINRFYKDPKLAKQTLDMSGLVGGEKKVRLTPADALRVELNQTMLDYLDLPASKKVANDYVDTINNLELKRGGSLTQLEREQLLLNFVQNQAMEVFKGDKNPDSLLMQRGALGGSYNVLRKVYDNYGITVDDKTIYKQAVEGMRSRQALENIVQKIGVQAQVAFPALEKFFQQGLTTKEALAAYTGIYSKIYGVPENSVEISKMYPVFKGKELMSPEEWQKYLYSLPEFKKTKLYQQRSFSDAEVLMNNFGL
jgi:hypothetical protein